MAVFASICYNTHIGSFEAIIFLQFIFHKNGWIHFIIFDWCFSVQHAHTSLAHSYLYLCSKTHIWTALMEICSVQSLALIHKASFPFNKSCIPKMFVRSNIFIAPGWRMYGWILLFCSHTHECDRWLQHLKLSAYLIVIVDANRNKICSFWPNTKIAAKKLANLCRWEGN